MMGISQHFILAPKRLWSKILHTTSEEKNIQLSWIVPERYLASLILKTFSDENYELLSYPILTSIVTIIAMFLLLSLQVLRTIII